MDKEAWVVNEVIIQGMGKLLKKIKNVFLPKLALADYVRERYFFDGGSVGRD